MPLWFDLLRTPMAAPETTALKRMRLVWLGLCVLTAGGAGVFGPIHRALGRTASIAMAFLVFASILWTTLYLMRKQRADNAFLEAAGEQE